MLESLHISNYALIDNIDIRFYDGLNIITGETGAGKSIILGALSLLLGGRADMKAIRHTDRKSIIECIFNVNHNSSLRQYCIENDIECGDDNQCILRRELLPSGRSRAFINDSPVTLSQLQGIGLLLIDIHSQHQNQLLAQPDFQRQIIDTLASNNERMAVYAERFTKVREAMRRLKATRAAIERDRENADFMQYQLNQLDGMNLSADELNRLEHDRDIIANDTDVKRYVSEATNALSEGPHNIIALLDNVRDCCAELESILPESDNIPSRIDAIITDITDIAQTIASLNDDISADPEELEQIERRISDINTMLQHHHAESVQQLIDMREQLRSRLSRIDDSETLLSDLKKEARQARAQALESAEEISAARHTAATAFSETLQKTATPLGMKNLQCEIAIEPTDMAATGIDNVEFRFAFNKNQTPIPVSGAASGGEISRLMLSIKAIIAGKMQLPSIIFDEVDTGVSGDVASRMGQMMKDISSDIQVIAITHLPQVAAKGAHHFKVYKEDDDDATHTHINELSMPQRIDELALMLSGDSSNEAARANAISLLQNA